MNQRRRRRRSGGPPPRLGWPAGGSGVTAISAATKGKNSGEGRTSTDTNKSSKRSRKEASSSQQQQQTSLLWTDAYAPTRLEDVCVAPKKVKEVSQWIEQSLQQHTKKLLILVGSPGIGKSTMIRLIAQENKLQISEWNEAASSYIAAGAGGGGILSVDQQSAVASFQQFLQQSGVGFHALNFGGLPQTNAPTTGRSKKTTTSTMDVLDLTNSDNEDKQASSPTKKRRTGPSNHSPEDTLILIEEIPNLYSTEAEEEFRDIMDQHIRQTVVPTVLIVSTVVEGKCRPDQLERWVSHSLLYGPHVNIMQIHPPTKIRFQRVLQRAAKGQGFGISKERAEELHEETSGDVRAAIGRLQCEYTGRESSGCRLRRRQTQGTAVPPDKKLSTFHALGKLLYAKRKPGVTTVTNWPMLNGNDNRKKWDDTRGRLEFDPENVIDQSEMELGGVLQFVQYHCMDFFEDVSELSVALDHFSDAAFWFDRPNAQPTRQYSGSQNRSTSADAHFPYAYAGSLAGRAVASANKHPRPSKFRQFTSPKVYEVLKKQRENQVQLKLIDRHLSEGHRLSLGQTSLLASDRLPYLRILLPSDVLSLDRLQSHFRPIHTSNDDDDDEARWKEQEEILQADDIDEFDDASEEGINGFVGEFFPKRTEI